MKVITANVPDDAPSWIRGLVLRIQEAINSPVDGVIYRPLHVEPKKLTEGLTVEADGTDWDPGSGAGLYIYRSGAWVFIG